MLTGEKATIVQHCAVFGTLKTEVRKLTIGTPRPYAQHRVSITISFVKPRERKWSSYTMTPDDLRYLTIEQDGKVLYDSRTDVPVDMEAWRARYAEERARWLARQAEIDRENERDKARGIRTQQMGDFRFDELANQ